MLYNFKKAGYQYEWAENGLEGYLLAKSFNPDIIVSDIMMPEFDGYELRKKILDDPKLKQIPFIFLTAKGDENDILEGYDLNVEDYIVKTSGTRIILAKIAALLKTAQKEREKAVNEVHQAANSMGAKVVPDESPNFEGFSINHWHVPFQNVPGGDFIDYFKVDDDNLIVVLGDIMGKKWGAWYFAVAYAGYVRSAIRMILDSDHVVSPATILNKVNSAIYKDERISDVFITLSIISINRKTNTIKYSGAGDLPLIHKSESVKSIKSNGILIGFGEIGNYENCEVQLKSGESVYLITDGIPETRCTNGEFFGEGRLKEIIGTLEHSDDTLEKIKTEFISSTENKFEDDISIIAIKAN
ncbi:MAG: fused response regulator/phosphatase [Ignavibacteriae bacterium]|nr:fused response regulator/phosphatase [Ignavibacteriota bacterium]MCB9208064.1 fused response regulator/phosphatase [Ignavibacteriales bacterium]MCB9258830.1 fused response regulator/phosphatase [Ignavibacteriales bacterium]